MDLSNKLDQFRNDNPYDVHTQAKRLLASNNEELILYTLGLGLATAKQRQQHTERAIIKNTGIAPQKERLTPGRVTGSVKVIPVPLSKRTQNALEQLIGDVWKVGDKSLNDCSGNTLTEAVDREIRSANGHSKNATFYRNLKEPMKPHEIVRYKWDNQAIRSEIEKAYGEFRKEEAA